MSVDWWKNTHKIFIELTPEKNVFSSFFRFNFDELWHALTNKLRLFLLLNFTDKLLMQLERERIKCNFKFLRIPTGTCLQLFEKWRCSAHLKLLQLIWKQPNFLNKQRKQSLSFLSRKSLDGVTCVPVPMAWLVLNLF